MQAFHGYVSQHVENVDAGASCFHSLPFAKDELKLSFKIWCIGDVETKPGESRSLAFKKHFLAARFIPIDLTSDLQDCVNTSDAINLTLVYHLNIAKEEVEHYYISKLLAQQHQS